MEGQAKQAYFVNEAYNHEEQPHGAGGGGADGGGASGAAAVADNLPRRRSGGNNKELQLNMSNKKAQELAETAPPAIDFDDLLPLIGEFGRYQKILFLLMIPFSFFVAFVYFSQIFLTLIPDQHWCHVPELDALDVEAR